MNTKEIQTLQRRLRVDKNAITTLHGCYVNGKKKIVSTIHEPIGRLPEEDVKQYFGFLKKALSGKAGKNLLELEFGGYGRRGGDARQVLLDTRNAKSSDTETYEAFFQRVIENINMEGVNYLILVVNDTYDVPYRSKDDETQHDASDRVFRYMLCAICPVKDEKLRLGYSFGENEFRTMIAQQIVNSPDVGFLYPAFEDRSENPDKVLYYSKKPNNIHQEFIDGMFEIHPPMSAEEQKEAFNDALSDALQSSCSMPVVQAVYGEMQKKIEQHNATKDADPLTVSVDDIKSILSDCGVDTEKTEEFHRQIEDQFGEDFAFAPQNIIDIRRFEVRSGGITLTVSPEQSNLIQTKIIDGRKYILIPADAGTEINGLPISIS